MNSAFTVPLLATIFIVFCQLQGTDSAVAQCINGDVTPLEEGRCARKYLLCEKGAWTNAMCVGTVFNKTSSRCVPYSESCPDPGIIERAFSARKRRATLDCNKSFACPNDITNIFIYPDWSDKTCNSYVVCYRGTLLTSNCKADGYNYYNPRRLSCEQVDSFTNTCLHRLSTDLSVLYR